MLDMWGNRAPVGKMSRIPMLPMLQKGAYSVILSRKISKLSVNRRRIQYQLYKRDPKKNGGKPFEPQAKVQPNIGHVLTKG